MIPIVCVIGKSRVGKTPLMEKLVAEVKKRGYKVATIKHSHHGFKPDREGKECAICGIEILYFSSVVCCAFA